MPQEHAGYQATAAKKRGNVNKINEPLAKKESILARYTGTNASVVAAAAAAPALLAPVPVAPAPNAPPVAPSAPSTYAARPIDPTIQFLMQQQQAMMAQMLAHIGQQQPQVMGQTPLPAFNMPPPLQPNIPYTAADAYNKPLCAIRTRRASA